MLYICYNIALKECAEILQAENMNFEKWTFLNV